MVFDHRHLSSKADILWQKHDLEWNETYLAFEAWTFGPIGYTKQYRYLNILCFV